MSHTFLGSPAAEERISLFTMPPPSQSPALALTLLAEPFFVLQTEKPSAALLAAFTTPEVPGQFLSITRTKEELSIVGSMGTGSVVPEGAEAKWKCLRVAGPMDFGMSSILDDYGELMDSRAHWDHVGADRAARQGWRADLCRLDMVGCVVDSSWTSALILR
jgi:hypothetical protein